MYQRHGDNFRSAYFKVDQDSSKGMQLFYGGGKCSLFFLTGFYLVEGLFPTITIAINFLFAYIIELFLVCEEFYVFLCLFCKDLQDSAFLLFIPPLQIN